MRELLGEATMRHIVPLIWEAVRADVAAGSIVDVDAYCERFMLERTGMSEKAFRSLVLEVVAEHEGVARFGRNTS